MHQESRPESEISFWETALKAEISLREASQQDGGLPIDSATAQISRIFQDKIAKYSRIQDVQRQFGRGRVPQRYLSEEVGILKIVEPNPEI
ncbi:MAG: hypothetical protein KDD70_14135 [Bdellovibrionales bacterium]|nr:hypothetical protein [Bdellovibrionales bacterium]